MTLETRVERVIVDLKEIYSDCHMIDQRDAVMAAIRILELTSFWEMH